MSLLNTHLVRQNPSKLVVVSADVGAVLVSAGWRTALQKALTLLLKRRAKEGESEGRRERRRKQFLLPISPCHQGITFAPILSLSLSVPEELICISKEKQLLHYPGDKAVTHILRQLLILLEFFQENAEKKKTPMSLVTIKYPREAKWPVRSVLMTGSCILITRLITCAANGETVPLPRLFEHIRA